MSTSLEPHPLDFDWRFTPETALMLCELVMSAEKTLCVGTPSVAEILQQINRNVILVDRQPIQPVKHHIIADPDTDPPVNGRFNAVIIDPPWYLENYYRWLSWVCQSISHQVTILASLWPKSTRPTATYEREELFEWINTWGTVEVITDALRYQTPIFEIESLNTQHKNVEQLNWRTGDLLIIKPNSKPSLRSPLIKEESWSRFVINNYQLALKVKEDNKFPCIKRHPEAIGWTWPSVSIRASGRNEIGLWSSRNEVAIVDNSSQLLILLKKMVILGTKIGQKSLNNPDLEALAPLLEWQIPTDSFSRILIWTHHA